MAREWLYKATDSLAPLKETRDLALNDHFLAKAAYENSDRKMRADHVKAVVVGDIIHFYFKRLSDPRHVAHVIGSFEVADASVDPSRFSWPTEQTHLVTVIDEAFVQYLKSQGYENDRQLGVMTGWTLRQAVAKTPSYDPDLFVAQRCFLERP